MLVRCPPPPLSEIDGEWCAALKGSFSELFLINREHHFFFPPSTASAINFDSIAFAVRFAGNFEA
jgi:hypothetical protein